MRRRRRRFTDLGGQGHLYRWWPRSMVLDGRIASDDRGPVGRGPGQARLTLNNHIAPSSSIFLKHSYLRLMRQFIALVSGRAVPSAPRSDLRVL